MNCSSANTYFSVAFDDRLGKSLRVRFDAHLDQCTPCREAFEHYERVFMAVRSTPSSHLEKSAPLPASSRAFAANRTTRRRRTSWAAVACLLILLGGVGTVAFDLGQSTRWIDSNGSDGETASEPNGPDVSRDGIVNAVYPAKNVGKRFRRTHNATENLGALTEIAVASPNPGMIELLDRYISETTLRGDLRTLSSLDTHSLGDFTEIIHLFAGELDQVLQDSSRILRSGRPGYRDTKTKLKDVRRVVLDSRVSRYAAELRSVARRYDPAPFDVERSALGNSVDQFLRGLKFSIRGRHHQAAKFFELIVSDEGSGLKLPAEAFVLRSRSASGQREDVELFGRDRKSRDAFGYFFDWFDAPPVNFKITLIGPGGRTVIQGGGESSSPKHLQLTAPRPRAIQPDGLFKRIKPRKGMAPGTKKKL